MNRYAPMILIFLLGGYIGGVGAVTFPNTIEWVPSGGGVITFQEGFSSSNATVSDLVLFRDFSWGNTDYNVIGWSLDAGSSMVVNSVSDTLVKMTLNVSGENGTLTVYIPEKTILAIDGVNSWSWENGSVIVVVKGSMLASVSTITISLLGPTGSSGGISWWMLICGVALMLFVLLIVGRRR